MSAAQTWLAAVGAAVEKPVLDKIMCSGRKSRYGLPDE